MALSALRQEYPLFQYSTSSSNFVLLIPRCHSSSSSSPTYLGARQSANRVCKSSRSSSETFTLNGLMLSVDEDVSVSDVVPNVNSSETRKSTMRGPEVDAAILSCCSVSSTILQSISNASEETGILRNGSRRYHTKWQVSTEFIDHSGVDKSYFIPTILPQIVMSG